MKWLFFLSAFFSFLSAGDFTLNDVMNFVFNPFDNELCNEKYISPNFHQLEFNLKTKLFGQHLVIDKLVPLLRNHFELVPKKALVICMHGWTGSGKNYVTQIINDSIFKKKSESNFVRMFNGRLHFPIDQEENVNLYKINIQKWVQGNVTECPRSVFIFDEIDKMPAGIIDVLKPFLDYHEKIDSVDYRKSIFIFISNIGADVINSRYMELWKRGNFRDDLTYKDFEPYLRNALYNTKGGFKESSVIDGHLVSLYLPFLPLGVEQVEQCIKAEWARQGVESVKDEYVEEVLNEMEFNSDGFSVSGCKRIADIVTAVKYKKRFEEL